MKLNPHISRKVLTVGEYLGDGVHGGIGAVLRSYRPYFETFRFVASSRRSTRMDKFRYDLGGWFVLAWNLLRYRTIRIVHIHTAAGGSFPKHLYYARLAAWMGRRVILHCHASRFEDWYGSLSTGKRRRVLAGILRTDRLICLSQSWKGYFEGIGVPAAKIRVLNNITPDPQFTRPERGEGAPLRLLFLGEIGPRKGAFDLLEAIAGIAPAQRRALRLDIGGNGMEQEMRAAIDAAGLGDCVHFHGFVSGDRKRELLEQADAFVLPSRNEGLPISILEAMSYSQAIVSTPVGGIPEVVRDNGLLVPPGDIPALRAALLRLTDGNLCEEMGHRSLEIVRDFYPEAVIPALEAIYSELQ